MTYETLPSFDDLESALAWMYREVDDHCIDNVRAARCNDYDAVTKYDYQAQDGCCGSYDTRVLIAGEEYYIGCNFGH